MSPLFSIIVPVYRSGPFLRDCLDSIRNQTLTDWECICINDGSPDDSGAILDEYARKDARFTAIHQENKGTLANMLGINGTIHAAMALGMPEFRFSNYIDKKDTVETDL